MIHKWSTAKSSCIYNKFVWQSEVLTNEHTFSCLENELGQ